MEWNILTSSRHKFLKEKYINTVKHEFIPTILNSKDQGSFNLYITLVINFSLSSYEEKKINKGS